MRPNSAELRGLAGNPDDVVHGLTGQLRLAFGDEKPRQLVLSGGQVSLDGAELVAGDGMLDAK